MPGNIFQKTLSSLTALNIFFFVNFLFGFYHDFSCIRSKKIAFFLKFVFTGYPLILCFLTFRELRVGFDSYYVYILDISAYEITMCVLASLFTNYGYFFRHFTVMSSIDANMNFSMPRFDNPIAFSGLIVISLCRIATFIVNITDKPFLLYVWQFHLFNYLYQAGSLSKTPNMFLFESLYHRMKLLRIYLVEHLDGEVSDEEKLRVWKKGLYAYKNLLDNADEAWKTIRIIMIFALPAQYIRYLFVAWNFLGSFIVRDRILHIDTFSTTIEVVCAFLPMIVQLVVLERVIAEYEQIQKVLMDQMILTTSLTDEELVQQLSIVEEYLEVRPPKYSLLRTVPLDINLLVAGFSSITTYAIALIQTGN